jgi:hypothetical protein
MTAYVGVRKANTKRSEVRRDDRNTKQRFSLSRRCETHHTHRLARYPSNVSKRSSQSPSELSRNQRNLGLWGDVLAQHAADDGCRRVVRDHDLHGPGCRALILRQRSKTTFASRWRSFPCKCRRSNSLEVLLPSCYLNGISTATSKIWGSAARPEEPLADDLACRRCARLLAQHSLPSLLVHKMRTS